MRWRVVQPLDSRLVNADRHCMFSDLPTYGCSPRLLIIRSMGITYVGIMHHCGESLTPNEWSTTPFHTSSDVFCRRGRATGVGSPPTICGSSCKRPLPKTSPEFAAKHIESRCAPTAAQITCWATRKVAAAPFAEVFAAADVAPALTARV